MLNTSKTTKGNKTLDKGVIPFYTKEAFPSDSTTKEDDDVVAIKEKMVSIKLKIDETEGETRTNTYSRLVKSIKNFHVDELEQFMEVFSVLQEEILPELNFPDDSAEIRTFHKYMSVVCEEQAARQWKKSKWMPRRTSLVHTLPIVMRQSHTLLKSRIVTRSSKEETSQPGLKSVRQQLQKN
jgi:hypothetical protein